MMDAVAELDPIWDASTHDMHLPATMRWLDSNWQVFVVGPDLDIHQPHEETDYGSGVYFLWGPHDNLLYIGQSVDIERRLFMHQRYGKRFSTFGAIKVPPPALHAVEYAYIYALQPPLNSKYDRVWWKGHESMVKRIQEVWGPKEVRC